MLTCISNKRQLYTNCSESSDDVKILMKYNCDPLRKNQAYNADINFYYNYEQNTL